MSKHARLNHELVTVPATVLCTDVLHEVFKICEENDPGTNWVLQFTSRQLQQAAATFVPANPPRDDTISKSRAKNPANAFVTDAFRSGDLGRLQWAYRRGLRTNPWRGALRRPARMSGCGRLDDKHCEMCGGTDDLSSSSLRACDKRCEACGWTDGPSSSLRACFGGIYTQLSPFDAATACGEDDGGQTDHAFQWYLDTIFFPAISSAGQRLPEHLPLRNYLDCARHHLLLRAAEAGRLNFFMQLVGAGDPLTPRAREQVVRSAAYGSRDAGPGGHATIAAFILRDATSCPLRDIKDLRPSWETVEAAAANGAVDFLKAILPAVDAFSARTSDPMGMFGRSESVLRALL